MHTALPKPFTATQQPYNVYVSIYYSWCSAVTNLEQVTATKAKHLAYGNRWDRTINTNNTGSDIIEALHENHSSRRDEGQSRGVECAYSTCTSTLYSKDLYKAA
jgi:hypothetical protein